MDEAHGCVFRFLTCVNQAEPQNIALLLDDFSDNFTFVTQAVWTESSSHPELNQEKHISYK